MSCDKGSGPTNPNLTLADWLGVCDFFEDLVTWNNLG